MAVSVSGGAALGDHLAAVRRQGKETKAQPPPKLPPELRHVWSIYCELDATRAIGMTVGPIAYAELDAFSRLTGTHLTPFEVGALRALDRAFFEHRAEAMKK